MSYEISKFGIKISETEKLEEALDAVNGRASRFILTASEAVGFAKDAEQQLVKAGIAPTFRPGATATFYGFAPDKGYSYSVATTKMTMRRFKEGWRVMSVERTSMYPGDSKSGKIIVTLSDEQYRKAVKHHLGHFSVAEAA